MRLWKRLLTFLTLLGAVLFVWPLLWLWASYPSLLAQEPDDGLSLLQAAPRALVQPLVTVEGAKPIYLTRQQANFEQWLTQQGWQLQERSGALATYQKGTEKMQAGCRRFSRYFWVCETGRELNMYQAP